MTAMRELRFIDLFCGIGGFRVALEQLGAADDFRTCCVFSSDIDTHAQDSYEANFGERPAGDITRIEAADIPDHDILFAGFPCQAFSIIGKRGGFDDTRGTLFFDVARILREKRPQAFVLENVKQLVGHDKGRTLGTILATLNELGYHVHYKVLNALDYGLPQKRERVVIVGTKEFSMFQFPAPLAEFKPLGEVLQPDSEIPANYFASDYIREKRHAVHVSQHHPGIWHENKSGNISSHPFSCALRAGASYNYLLVDGNRRLTPREMLRLQGFPDSYEIAVSDGQLRKQAGNSIPVNMIQAVLQQLLPHLSLSETSVRTPTSEHLDPIAA